MRRPADHRRGSGHHRRAGLRPAPPSPDRLLSRASSPSSSIRPRISSPAVSDNPDGLSSDAPQARLGESWARDVVVLAWDHVLSGASDIHDGHNVVLHEFAHQLDQESGAGDGAPILPRRSMYVAWARVLGHEFDELVRETHRHHRTRHRSIRRDQPRGVLRRRHRDLLREAAAAAVQAPGAATGNCSSSINRIPRPSKTAELGAVAVVTTTSCSKRVPAGTLLADVIEDR